MKMEHSEATWYTRESWVFREIFMQQTFPSSGTDRKMKSWSGLSHMQVLHTESSHWSDKIHCCGLLWLAGALWHLRKGHPYHLLSVPFNWRFCWGLKQTLCIQSRCYVTKSYLFSGSNGFMCLKMHHWRNKYLEIGVHHKMHRFRDFICGQMFI